MESDRSDEKIVYVYENYKKTVELAVCHASQQLQSCLSSV